MPDRRSSLPVAMLVAFAALCLYLVPSWRGRALTETPEARVAVVAREMLQTGNYVVPTLGGTPRLIKPPLPYWQAAAAAGILGGNGELSQDVMARAVQIASAIAGALSVLLVVWFGGIVFGRTAGVLAGLVLSTSLLPSVYAELGNCDTSLALFCTGMFCGTAWMVAAPRPAVWVAIATGACLGLGILTKWYIPAVLLLLPLVAEICLRRGLERHKLLLYALAFAVAAAVAVPWFVLVERRLPGACWTIFNDIVYSTKPLAHLPDGPWTYYFERLFSGMLPWTVPLLGAVWLWARGAKESAKDAGEAANGAAREHLRFLGLAVGLGFLAFYSQSKQQGYYLLPLVPVLALLAGYSLSRFCTPDGRAERALARWLTIAGVFLGVVAAALPYWGRFLPAAHQELSSFRNLLDSLGWSWSLLAGVVLAGVVAVWARQWQKGRPVRAALMLAAPAYCCLVAWSWHQAEKSRNWELYRESARLRHELAAVDQGARVYGSGAATALLVFYLERPVGTLRELAEEPEGQTGLGAPKRVLVITDDSVQRWRLTSFFQAVPDGFFVTALTPDVDWPRQLRQLVPSVKHSADTSDDE